MFDSSSLQLIGFHLAAGVGMFYFLNWLGSKTEIFGYETLDIFKEREESFAFNFVFRVVTPVVLIILIAAACYSLGFDALVVDIHHAVYFYIFWRAVWNLSHGRFWLLPWPRLISQWVATAVISALAYKHVILEKDYLFPDVKTIGNELWLAIIGYLYILADKVFSGDEAAVKRSGRYIKRRGEAIRTAFREVLEKRLPNPRWRALIVAVLIVEDFNRPSIKRLGERILFRFGRAKTLGIMQVRTKRLISDEESVVAGIEHLTQCYNEIIESNEWRSSYNFDIATRLYDEEESIIHKTLTAYNPSGDYARDVQTVFTRVLSMFPGADRDSLHPEFSASK
jgi:hypothetical protein